MQIGNYNITDKEIDQYIATLAPEQQMYKDVPAFRDQVKSRLEEISLFAMEGEEKHLDDTEEYKNTLSVVRRDVLGQLAMAEIINWMSLMKKLKIIMRTIRNSLEEQLL